MKKFFLLILLTGLVMGLFCLPAAADSISVYTSLDEQLAREVFKVYEKDTGISIEWVRLSTGEAVSRMMAEKNNPQASIWVGGVGLGHIQAKESGLTVPFTSENSEYVPANFKDEEAPSSRTCLLPGVERSILSPCPTDKNVTSKSLLKKGLIRKIRIIKKLTETI